MIQDPLPSHRSRIQSRLRALDSTMVGNYHLKDVIGTGGFARVRRAIHRPTGQVVAVKVISKRVMSQIELLNVKKEVEIQRSLIHENVVSIFEMQEHQDKIFIFMEYCPNGQLFDRINTSGPLPEPQAARIFMQLLTAVEYMSINKVAHRDIKTENILFAANGKVKLADFGFACNYSQNQMNRTFCGSPSYTSPEIVMKEDYSAQAADVWCLGVTLYAMLTGELPFERNAPAETKRKIVEMDYQIKSSFSSEVKALLRNIFVLQKNRIPLNELKYSSFCTKYESAKSNYVNKRFEQMPIDETTLHIIAEEQRTSVEKVRKSVEDCLLDELCGSYHLRMLHQFERGEKLQFNINHSQFSKQAKKLKTIRSVKSKEETHPYLDTPSKPRPKGGIRELLQTKELKDVKESLYLNSRQALVIQTDRPRGRVVSGKKNSSSNLRCRVLAPSLDIGSCRIRRQDDSPESPKRLIDCLSAYKQ